MSNPELTVVIPTLGRGAKLRRAVERLATQEGACEFEVVVVLDAAAADEDADIDDSPGLRVVRADRAGASAARNYGWQNANSPLILFIDDDILASPQLVAHHFQSHQMAPHPTAGILGHVRWAEELEVTTFMHWLENGIQFDYVRIEGTEAGWGRFYTANVSVKRSMLERVGGFDEVRFPFGYEDLDLALRMSQHGFRLLYNSAARAEHLHEMDLEFWKRRIRRIAVAERAFVERHPEIPAYFFELLAPHEFEAPPRGRGARLASLIPRRTPILGERVWASVNAMYLHELAGPFMDAWRDETEPRGSAALIERGDPPALGQG